MFLEVNGCAYSFASKFLHWTTRRHFPIMDSRARVAIHYLQEKTGAHGQGLIPEMWNGGNTRTALVDYKKWITFSAQLIAYLPSAFWQNLVQQDTSELRRNFNGLYTILGGNHLLRVLDKYLFAKGWTLLKGFSRLQQSAVS
jgi:hypothetical protein